MRPASVRVVDGIHRDPADHEIRLAEGTEREPFLARVREGLVAAAGPRDRPDRRPTGRMEGAELPRGELDDRAVALAHDDRLRARRAHETAAVPGHRFDVVD